MGLRLSRSTLMVASAMALTCARPCLALAQDGTAQLGSIEKQIQALQAELRHMKAEMATRNRELRAAREAPPAPPPPTQLAPVMPQIPAGYALVPDSPGSAPGSVVLARAEPPPPKLPIGTFRVGAVDVQLGGFIDASSIFRSRNEVTDLSSNWNTGIPLRISPLYHEPEFRETARATRLSVTATAHPDDVTKIQASVVTDFQGAAPTSTSTQSNSYIPRLREGWVTYDRNDLGLEILGGQTWSLLTMTKQGTNPTQINLPLTIDQNYVPGFDYTRQPQFRVAKSFAQGQFWLAASIENPQTAYTNTSAPSSLATLNLTNPGIGGLANGSNSSVSACTAVTTTATTVKGKTTYTSTCATSAVTATGNFSDDIAPDVILKAVADFNLAHFEAFALGRVFHDRQSELGTGQSNTMFGGGGGGAALIHIIPKMLDFQLSGLVGTGVGRYGTSQLPDATIGADGKPDPLREYTALAGLIGHPSPKLDLYAYAGTEQTHRSYFNALNKEGGVITAYGYGNPAYSNLGCEEELSTSTCTANTSGIVQGTVGGYYKFLKGAFGTMQVGAQYSYTHRSIFQGVGRTPSTDENTVLLSFRYYPFQ